MIEEEINSAEEKKSFISFDFSDNEQKDEIIDQKKITPWISDQTRQIKNPNIRFHNEIIDFYSFIKPKPEAHKKRMKAFMRIKDLLESEIQETELIPFGSFITEFYLPFSDIDAVLIKKDYASKKLMKSTKKVIKKNSDIFINAEFLSHAKVPLVKFTDVEMGYDFDICFNEEDGINNIGEVKKACDHHPELKYIFFVVKLFLNQRKFSNTFTGGIGSFLLFCLVLTFLREFKDDFVFKKKDVQKLNNVSLSEYLMKFFQFYMNFDFNRKEIVVEGGGKIRTKNSNENGFVLYSPINGANIGGQAFRIREIFGTFKNRYNFVTNHSFKNKESILKYLINPSEKNFEIYLK